jgi:GTPase
LLVYVALDGKPAFDGDLDELDSLASSAAIEPASRLLVRRQRPDPAFYVGSGKVQEIAERISSQSLELVIFDDPISPVQQRNLTRELGVPVFDRVELILDIFAQRARSSEGKLQVDLARIEHQLSRLVRSWSHLERQRGGFGQRGGPGEKQVELDRRMLDTKARQLKLRLEKMAKQRGTRRRQRGRSDVPVVALVGYTNAGKSTLFNKLSKAQSYAADQLFATLDTLSRQLVLSATDRLVLTDTVGFVRNLPHTLVQAFKATLEETVQADLLLHIIDVASPHYLEQINEVNKVLATIGATDVPQVLVFNKADLNPALLPPDSPVMASENSVNPCDRLPRFRVSALTGAGMPELKEHLLHFVQQHRRLWEADAISNNPSANSLKDNHDAFVA